MASRLGLLCLHGPPEAAASIRAFHSTALNATPAARHFAPRSDPSGGGFRKTSGSSRGQPVAGRRKLVDLKELGPKSRAGGRLEIAHDRPGRSQGSKSDSGSGSWSKRANERPQQRNEKRHDVQVDPASSSQPFYNPKAPLDYSSSLSSSEFDNPPALVSTGQSVPLADTLRDLPKSFSAAPLLPGFISSIKDILGENAKPTPIQQLSLRWVLDYSKDEDRPFEWGQWLLASETGSGKSFAYLLPLLQGVKEAELRPPPPPPAAQGQKDVEAPEPLPLNPRAIILSPTHELSRQISSFAKTLVHNVKLRVVCASQNNSDLKASSRKVSSRDMANEVEPAVADAKISPVDVVVGTPMKIMDMVRGRWWDLKGGELGGTGRELDRGYLARKKTVGKPELGLANVEWVVIDEADVLLDPDFQEVTRTLLADISAAKGYPVELDPFPFSAASTQSPTTPLANAADKKPVTVNPNANSIEYPFNLLLTSATIPSSMSRYLDLYHPRLLRLASPRLHKLPESLKVEYVKWTGGNRFADVVRRAKEVWAADAVEAGSRRINPVAMTPAPVQETPELSKILIFCNKSSKVQELSAFMEEKGIKNIAVTSGKTEGSKKDQGEHEVARPRGSNKHLEGFLRPLRPKRKAAEAAEPTTKPKSNPNMLSDPSATPHVMITTSLLSRGLDFDPSIKHVFIVDEPRNMVDFLHRAGRSGRTGGMGGKVVVFGRSGSSGMEKRGGGAAAKMGASLGGAIASKKVLGKLTGGGYGASRR